MSPTKITETDLRQWRNNSLETARKLGYDSALLDKMRSEAHVWVTVEDRMEGTAGIWYGRCLYDPGQSFLGMGLPRGQRKLIWVQVSPQNISTAPEEVVHRELQNIGIPQQTLENIMTAYRSVPREEFFKIFNQSGMDHELIGHGYHYLHDEEDHGEERAVRTQLAFAGERAKTSEYWNVIREIMGPVLGHLKGIKELKT